MVTRRDFIRLAGAAAVSAAPVAAQAPPRRPALMKLGTQQGPTSDEMLRYFAQFGVKNVCGYPEKSGPHRTSTGDDLKRLRERVESFGLRLDLVPLPLASSAIARAENPNIMLGKSPERDREIDAICGMIRACAKAGIPAVKYNLTILGVVRTERTPGRGGSSYSTFVYEKARQDPPLTEAGRVTADMMWERIEYFLRRVVPVAEEHKVRLACHPHDPAMPPGGFRGVERVLGTVDGLKRFIEISPSLYHGLNFCQGTVCEGLKNPGKEIFDVIRHFGSRKKIFNVHFRNIRGGFLNFQEVYPDEGDVDMLAAMRVYKEVGYDGMMMPDHAPRTEGDEGGRQAHAFAFGYIRGLIQAVDSET